MVKNIYVFTIAISASEIFSKEGGNVLFNDALNTCFLTHPYRRQLLCIKLVYMLEIVSQRS